jgi:hypothetical protein
MKTTLQIEINSAKKISISAKRNYETYKEHYKSRNMTPALTLDDFLKNYNMS